MTRYQLAPTTRMLWRAADLVQFEIDGRGVVVEGLTTRTARSLTHPAADAPEGRCLGALRQLAELGYLRSRRRPLEPDDPEAPPAPGPLRAVEVAALSARRGELAARTVQARRAAAVEVHGTGRAGPAMGAILAASGVGRVSFHNDTDVKMHATLPGGVTPADVGQRFGVAARAAVRRAAPDVGGPALETARRAPELAVLAVDEPVGDDHRAALHAQTIPHLLVATRPGGAVVGPLVLPGLTSCLRCTDLHRTDRDDAWPRLAVQLTLNRRHGPASETAVATIAAGVAAMQALAFLDGEPDPACVEGTLELHPPDWRLRRRTWPLHPDCGCCGRQGWAQ